jgi:integrating conjugative element protein (TIGR03746 family)
MRVITFNTRASESLFTKPITATEIWQTVWLLSTSIFKKISRNFKCKTSLGVTLCDAAGSLVGKESIMSRLQKRFLRVFDAWKKEDQDRALIAIQNKFILILLCLCTAFFIGWLSAPSRLRIYIPPDISSGTTLKANEIPSAFIYSFAYEVWQELNYWHEEGTRDYAANIRVYGPYLTPSFKTELLQDYNELKTAGQVQRQRSMQSISGSYEASTIKKLSSDTWEVDLKVRLTEYKNNQLVKDVEMLYPLKVTRRDVSSHNNPYGLAVAGFVADPIRLKTYI